jgi:hypothetical protein
MPHKIVLHAGAHPRRQCPVRAPWPNADAPESLAFENRTVAAQRDGSELVFLPLPMEPETQAVYSPADTPADTGVELADLGDRIRVLIGGEEFTNYWYRDAPARPYFWPVYAPGGVAVTRNFPMRADTPDETKDHHHHRSMYFAFGSVNGVDNWSEEKGHGHTAHRTLDELLSGPVFGRFATTSDWTNSEGKKILTQKARVTFWNAGAQIRLMDVDLQLLATEGDVLFGDTKEGGLLTVRVASALDVPRGGRIENAYGGVNEPETWGYAAHWCDYSGIVEGRHVGIAVMDHPLSFRYPTYWHVRNYGLMAANPFALSDYTGGIKNGSHLLQAGETLRFVYRVLIHPGDAIQGDVRNHYLNFVAPPRAEAGKT